MLRVILDCLAIACALVWLVVRLGDWRRARGKKRPITVAEIMAMDDKIRFVRGDPPRGELSDEEKNDLARPKNVLDPRAFRINPDGGDPMAQFAAYQRKQREGE